MEKTRLLAQLNNTENLDYYEGRHFPYWVGATPSPSNPHRDRLIEELRKIFVSANFIKECVDRHTGALLGKPPVFKVTPLGELSPLATQGEEKVLGRWFDLVTNEGYQEIDDDVSPLLKSLTDCVVTGKGYLRLFTRRRFLESTDPVRKVSLHSPPAGSVEMIYDDEGSLEAIEYTLSNDKVERQELDPVTGVLHFFILHSKGKTKEEALEEFDVDLGFNWSIFELSFSPMITDAIKRLQNSINLTLTMMGRNIVQAGFIERILLNAQAPGRYIENSSGEIVFVPDPEGFHTGAGVTNIVTGIPLGDPMAPEGYTTPSAIFREPVSVATFQDSLRIYVGLLYNQFGQGHILTQGDGGISEVSRVQLTQDFKTTLHRQVAAIETAFSNCLTTASIMLNLAGAEQEVPSGSYVKVRLSVESHLLTPEERTAIREEFKAGIISNHTALELLKIEDVPGELERVAGERQQKVEEMSDAITSPPSGSSFGG